MGNNVFIVTGTTSGIGKALALEIAKTGQTLVMIARDVDRGQAATAPEFANTSGKFFHNGKEIEAPAYAYDRAAQQRLWERNEALTGLTSTKGELPITDPQF